MSRQSPHPGYIRSACLMLAVIQVVMLASLYFDVAPHPPRAIAPFAMAPFLAVSIGLCLCAMQLADTLPGRVLAGLSVFCALLSFGPQKYVDPSFSEIWVAVIAAQIASLVIIFHLLPRQPKKLDA